MKIPYYDAFEEQYLDMPMSCQNCAVQLQSIAADHDNDHPTTIACSDANMSDQITSVRQLYEQSPT